jgi:hypothetical protein
MAVSFNAHIVITLLAWATSVGLVWFALAVTLPWIKLIGQWRKNDALRL